MRYSITMKRNRWKSIITFGVAVFFGLAVGIFFSRGRMFFLSDHEGGRDLSDLRADLASEKTKYENLSDRQKELELKKKTLLQIYNENHYGNDQFREWKEYAFLAGLTDGSGMGMTITIDDKKDYDPVSDPIESVVHDSTITYIMGLLWGAGARGMALNGIRMTAVSEISCVGPAIMCYGVRLMPPYVIEVIGPPDRMKNVIKGDAWISRLSQKEIGVRIALSGEEELTLASFSKTHDFHPYMDLLLSVSEP